MIESMNNSLLNGLNIDEILRKHMKDDPLAEALHPDPADLADASAGNKDTVSVSAESQQAAQALLAEVNAPDDYAEKLLVAKRMDEREALDALAAEFNLLEHISEDMRDAIHDAAARGARKKNDDVYKATEKNVRDMKDDIERAAAAAVAPKDAAGNPIELPGSGSDAPAVDVPAAPVAPAAPNVAPQATPGADPETVLPEASAAQVVSATPRPLPKLNITV